MKNAHVKTTSSRHYPCDDEPIVGEYYIIGSNAAFKKATHMDITKWRFKISYRTLYKLIKIEPCRLIWKTYEV